MSNKQKTVAPAEQASKQVPPFALTAEAFEQIAQGWDGCAYPDAMIDDIGAALRADFKRLAGQPAAPVAANDTLRAAILALQSAYQDEPGDDYANGFASGHRNARWAAAELVSAAASEAAPVAATEQATCHTCKGRGYTDAGDPETGATKLDYPCTDCATPADAGAGLTAEEIVPGNYRVSCGGVWATAYEGASDLREKLLAKIAQAHLARLSTSAAPVTANKQQEIDRIAAYWKDQARRGCVDAFECALREAWDVARQSPAPVTAEPVARLQEEVSDRPYSKGEKFFEVVILDRERCFDGMNLYAAQPAAQVPSRNDVLEEAARACEGEKVEETGISDDSAYNVATEHCAKAIRKLKGQPAAVHAAKEGGAK